MFKSNEINHQNESDDYSNNDENCDHHPAQLPGNNFSSADSSIFSV